MNINDEKLSLISWILGQDKIENISQLKALADQIDSSHQDISKIVGQTPKGVRVSKEMLLSRIITSLKEIEANQTISLEELENLSEKW